MDIYQAGTRLFQIIEEFNSQMIQGNVLSPPPRDQNTESLDLTIQDSGSGIAQAMEDFRQHVVPASIMIPHPQYMGLVNSSPLPGGVVADLLVSLLNNNGGASHQSPAMTRCEAEVIQLFKQVFRFPSYAVGMFLPGGTYANLQALYLSRVWSMEQKKRGRSAILDDLVVFTSSASHFSVTRSAKIVGFCENRIRAIATTGRGALDVVQLEQAIKETHAAGLCPAVVVATFGTTGTGAIDDLAAISKICKHFGLWLHVDACYGGATTFLDEFINLWNGIEQADSLAFDPHKWLFVPLASSVLLHRHQDLAHYAFQADASYIPGDSENAEAWQSGIPTSRRCAGFSAWMALKVHGLDLVRNTIRRNIALTRQLESELSEQGFDVLQDGQLSVCCARYPFSTKCQKQIDDLQIRLAQRAVDSGEVWFATVKHGGQLWLRFNIVNLHTTEQHIEKISQNLVNWVKEIVSEEVL